MKVLELALIGNGIGAEHPWMRAVLSRLPVKKLNQMFNSTNYILGHGMKAVANAKKSIQEGRSTNLMATVIEEAKKEGGGKGGLQDIDVQVEATSLIFAGSGTTANTLSYVLWSIATRPELRENLEMEAAMLSEGFQDADLEALPLLNATINETLRLYAAVPGSLPRVVPAQGATMCGHYLAPGTVVSTQAWTYHRDASLYPNPLDFDPSRFLDDPTGSTTNPKGAKATNSAFGAGAYTCLGIHLAWMELRYGVAMFLRSCKGAELAEGMQPLSPSELVNYFGEYSICCAPASVAFANVVLPVITPKAKKVELVIRTPPTTPSAIV
jgi:cytochrome P450